MRIHLAAVDDTELLGLMRARGQASAQHTLTEEASSADMVLLVGSFGRDPERLLDHALYRTMPAKCAVLTEDDNYLPLAPGVYCSAVEDESVRLGRVFSFCYPSMNGRYGNAFVANAATTHTPKPYLFSFQGGSTSLLRKKLFNIDYARADVLVEDTSTYYHWDPTQADRTLRQQRYAEVLAGSHFVLCPRGAGAGSIRFFETMRAGIAPVLLADNYALPAHVDWSTFLLRFAERDIARLPALLEPHRHESAERGRLAQLAFEEHFAPAVEFDAIIRDCAAALANAAPVEEKFRARQQAMIRKLRRKEQMYTFARGAVLKTLKALGLKNPYRMNER
jgi:hypothetical protein